MQQVLVLSLLADSAAAFTPALADLKLVNIDKKIAGTLVIISIIVNLYAVIRTVHMNINIPSVDSVSRRETPLITAARMGQLDCVR